MIKCFVVVTGGLPHPVLHARKAKAVLKFLKELDGLIAIHIFDRYHTFLCFGTLNQAKVARNRIRAEGNPAGNNIMSAEISDDRQTLNVLDRAD